MTREEIIQAISDDKMMPFIQPEQLARIVDFVSENYKPSLPEGLEEAAEESWQNSPAKGIYDEYSPFYKDGFIAGAEWQKAKMLEDAVEIEVKEDAGGFPIVPLDVIELYDYENDKPLAKAGDKVKVIVIKED